MIPCTTSTGLRRTTAEQEETAPQVAACPTTPPPGLHPCPSEHSPSCLQRDRCRVLRRGGLPLPRLTQPVYSSQALRLTEEEGGIPTPALVRQTDQVRF